MMAEDRTIDRTSDEDPAGLGWLASQAAELRRIARHIPGADAKGAVEAIALRLESAEVYYRLGGLPAQSAPMTTLERASRWIKAHPGSRGQDVADAIGVSWAHFRRRIAPRLKLEGMRVERGKGGHFFPPT